MKTILALLVLVSLVACGKKKNSSTSYVATSLLSLQSKGLSFYSSSYGYGSRASIQCYQNGTTVTEKIRELQNLQSSLGMGYTNSMALGGNGISPAQMSQLISQAIYTLQAYQGYNGNNTYCPQTLASI